MALESSNRKGLSGVLIDGRAIGWTRWDSYCEVIDTVSTDQYFRNHSVAQRGHVVRDANLSVDYRSCFAAARSSPVGASDIDIRQCILGDSSLTFLWPEQTIVGAVAHSGGRVAMPFVGHSS